MCERYVGIEKFLLTPLQRLHLEDALQVVGVYTAKMLLLTAVVVSRPLCGGFSKILAFPQSELASNYRRNVETS